MKYSKLLASNFLDDASENTEINKDIDQALYTPIVDFLTYVRRFHDDKNHAIDDGVARRWTYKALLDSKMIDVYGNPTPNIDEVVGKNTVKHLVVLDENGNSDVTGQDIEDLVGRALNGDADSDGVVKLEDVHVDFYDSLEFPLFINKLFNVFMTGLKNGYSLDDDDDDEVGGILTITDSDGDEVDKETFAKDIYHHAIEDGLIKASGKPTPKGIEMLGGGMAFFLPSDKYVVEHDMTTEQYRNDVEPFKNYDLSHFKRSDHGMSVDVAVTYDVAKRVISGELVGDRQECLNLVAKLKSQYDEADLML